MFARHRSIAAGERPLSTLTDCVGTWRPYIQKLLYRAGYEATGTPGCRGSRLSPGAECVHEYHSCQSLCTWECPTCESELEPRKTEYMLQSLKWVFASGQVQSLCITTREIVD